MSKIRGKQICILFHFFGFVGEHRAHDRDRDAVDDVHFGYVM